MAPQKPPEPAASSTLGDGARGPGLWLWEVGGSLRLCNGVALQSSLVTPPPLWASRWLSSGEGTPSPAHHLPRLRG